MNNFNDLTQFRNIFDKWKYAHYTRKFKGSAYNHERDRASPINIALWRIATSVDPLTCEVVTSHIDMSQEKDGIRHRSFYTTPRGCIRASGLSFIFGGTHALRMEKIYITSREEFIGDPPAAVCAYMDEVWKEAERNVKEQSKRDKDREILHGIMECVLDETGL